MSSILLVILLTNLNTVLYRVHEVLVFDIVKRVVNIINFIPKKKLKATV